VIDSGPY